MRSSHNFSVKNYTKIFYTFYRVNVLSLQCKMSPNQAMSMGEVDGLSLIFTDSYALVLTPCPHCSEAAL